MGLFRSRPSDLPPAPPVPRDVEALEELVKNLESATDEASTWRIWASTYLEFYDLALATIWCVENGTPRLEYEVGPLAPAMAGTSGMATLVNRAARGGRPFYVTEGATETDGRWAAAHRAGARAVGLH